MTKTEPCDECGADGESLLCICEPETLSASDNRNVRRRKPAMRDLPDAGKSTSCVPNHHDAETALRHYRAPQVTGPVVKVKCCRCMDVHDHASRTNEWGKPIGPKWMAGRKSWCPTGCGYHVTIPAED